MHTPTDNLTQIRQYLTGKSAEELVDLLMDLLQQMDEAEAEFFGDDEFDLEEDSGGNGYFID